LRPGGTIARFGMRQVLHQADLDEQSSHAIAESGRVPGQVHMGWPAERSFRFRGDDACGRRVDAERADVLVQCARRRAGGGQDGDHLQAVQFSDPRQHVSDQEDPQVRETGPRSVGRPVDAHPERD